MIQTRPIQLVLMLSLLLALSSQAVASQALLTSLTNVAHPLEDSGDLAPLYAAIGERRTVLLGEASHGTHEYYQWRAAITRHLIEHKGFTVVAVEGDWSAMQVLNRYVKHMDDAPDNARQALLQLERWPRWMWANEETLELLEWLRDYNRDRKPSQRVGFYGMDVYGMAASLDKAPPYLARLDAEAAKEMDAAFACFRPFADDPRAYHSALARGAGCEQVLADTLQALQQRDDEFRQRDAEAWLHAEQNAAIVRRGEKHYRLMGSRDSSSWNARARNFYETLERLRNYHGDDTGVVAWAHNTHVGDVRATRAAPDQENLGMHARRALGEEQVFIVGFGSQRGSVIASRAWEGRREQMTLPRAAPGSLEDILHRLDQPLMLFLAAELRGIAELDNYLGHRAVGVVYRPEQEQRGNYVPTRWPQRYDGFLFIEQTRALSPLHTRE